MSNKIPEMMDDTISKIRNMVDVNSVIGDPITTADGVTIIPVSRVSVGFAGGGSDFVPKTLTQGEKPFGGAAGAGVKVTPVAFLIIKDGSVRMLPIGVAPNTATDRLVEMIPEALDKITDFVDKCLEKKSE